MRSGGTSWLRFTAMVGVGLCVLAASAVGDGEVRAAANGVDDVADSRLARAAGALSARAGVSEAAVSICRPASKSFPTQSGCW